MKKYLISLLITLFLLSCTTGINSFGKDEELGRKTIFINQVGYINNQEKYFLTDSFEGSFSLVESKSNKVVYKGRVKLWQMEDPATGLNLCKGDFSDFTKEGDFYIWMEDGSTSFVFTISENPYLKVRNDSLKSFYFQRSGMDLIEEHAGMFNRVGGHRDKLDYHPSSPIEGKKDVSGGWYDAGDFGRYITPGSIALGLMLIGYEQFPEKFSFDNLNIPESGNGIPDFLDEMKYEIFWMLKMQHREDDEYKGLLPYMVNSKSYLWEMPSIESQKQEIYGFSTFATANFTAVTSMAYRVYKDIDPKFAKKCLEASKLAWEAIEDREEYPKGGYQRPEGTATGGYAEKAIDNFYEVDDRTWAAVELYLSTGDRRYEEYAQNGLLSESGWSMGWLDTIGFAKIQYLLGDGADTHLKTTLREEFIAYCEELITQLEGDGFKTVLKPEDYIWGSNGELLLRAQQLILGYEITNNRKFYNGALYQLNYMLGLNVNNISFVVGNGTVYPKNIHHAVMDSDGVEESFPGLIPGGPNKNLDNDNTLRDYFTDDTPPARCYIDDGGSWATNENCIIYSAPLIPVSAYFTN